MLASLVHYSGPHFALPERGILSRPMRYSYPAQVSRRSKDGAKLQHRQLAVRLTAIEILGWCPVYRRLTINLEGGERRGRTWLTWNASVDEQRFDFKSTAAVGCISPGPVKPICSTSDQKNRFQSRTFFRKSEEGIYSSLALTRLSYYEKLGIFPSANKVEPLGAAFCRPWYADGEFVGFRSRGARRGKTHQPTFGVVRVTKKL